MTSKITAREAQKQGLIDYSHQSDFFDPVNTLGNVSVVGVGGIGSPTVLGLARMGIPILNVYDDDNVEPHNVATQHYSLDHVGKPKVEAISEQAGKISFSEVRSNKKRVGNNDFLLGNIVVSAVDSMKSRKEVFEAAKKSPSVSHLIDGRLGGQLIMCMSIDIRNRDHVEWYLSDEIMFDDSESESNSCTARGIYDVGLGVSALICRNVRKLLNQEKIHTQQIFNMDTLSLNAEGL